VRRVIARLFFLVFVSTFIDPNLLCLLLVNELLPYFLRITPGLIIITLVFFLLPKKQILARIFVLILGFILMRDVMTPVGFWNFGITEPVLWLRFTDNSLTLLTLSALSIIVSFLLLKIKTLGPLVEWGDLRSWKTYLVGILCGLLVALPFMALGYGVPISERGESVALAMLPILFLFAFAGNFLEELLFRGFLQSYFSKHMKSLRAAIISGLMFAAAHIFLASAVTNLGWPILVFVSIEGLVCAFVYRKYGLVSAAIVHGLVIFLLAAGLL